LENHAATRAAANRGCSNEIASIVEDDAGERVGTIVRIGTEIVQSCERLSGCESAAHQDSDGQVPGCG
jgi:hypothetical protein